MILVIREFSMRIEGEPRVLVIQPRKDYQKITVEQESLQVIAKKIGVELVFVNPLLEDHHPWHNSQEMLQGITGTLWLGSSDIDLTIDTQDRNTYLQRVEKLAEQVLAENIPTVAICLGHQALHLLAGGKVERSPQYMEGGTRAARLNKAGKKDPLLKGVVTRDEHGFPIFYQMYHHKDTVTELGTGFTGLGVTPGGLNSVTRKGDIFTTQGHPEVYPITEQYLSKPVDEQLGQYVDTDAYITPELAPTIIIENFFNYVTARASSRRRQAA
jgi:GMP synthase-like glutamine amidotransferase